MGSYPHGGRTMGLYEQWNPLLYVVNSKSPASQLLISESVEKAFRHCGLDIGTLSPAHQGGIGWMIGNASPRYGLELEDKVRAELENFRERMKDPKVDDWKAMLSPSGGFFGQGESLGAFEVSDDKLVLSFHAPRVTPEMADALRKLFVEYHFSSELQLVDGVSGQDPHPYVSSLLERDDGRVSGRLCSAPYHKLKKEALWFSVAKESAGNPHWLHDGRDVLVELRANPTQSYLELGEIAVRMGHILAGKPQPEPRELFLLLWHNLTDKLIDADLVTKRRLPGQEQILERLLTYCVLPHLDSDYAATNRFRPYNAMVFGPKGVGKTMLAAMLAVQRYDRGVVVPVSQETLVKDENSLFPRMEFEKQRLGVEFIPIIEDLDKITSASSESLGEGIMNSNIGNLLAGMGADRMVLIGTGNDPYIMDPNLLEAERLGGLMEHLGLPDDEDRECLVRNLLVGRPLEDGLPEDFVRVLAASTEGFSHRMIVDVVNRMVPLAAESRIAGTPEAGDFHAMTEMLSPEELSKALDYARDFYQFSHLQENESQIRSFFKALGRKPGNSIGFHPPVEARGGIRTLE